MPRHVRPPRQTFNKLSAFETASGMTSRLKVCAVAHPRKTEVKEHIKRNFVEHCLRALPVGAGVIQAGVIVADLWLGIQLGI
jgi:hypothetical protein